MSVFGAVVADPRRTLTPVFADLSVPEPLDMPWPEPVPCVSSASTPPAPSQSSSSPRSSAGPDLNCTKDPRALTTEPWALARHWHRLPFSEQHHWHHSGLQYMLRALGADFDAYSEAFVQDPRTGKLHFWHCHLPAVLSREVLRFAQSAPKESYIAGAGLPGVALEHGVGEVHSLTTLLHDPHTHPGGERMEVACPAPLRLPAEGCRPQRLMPETRGPRFESQVRK